MTKQSSSEDESNMPTEEVKQIKESKLKYLSEKQNEFGTNHFYQVLNESFLNELNELEKTMKILISEYNKKLHLEINVVKVRGTDRK